MTLADHGDLLAGAIGVVLIGFAEGLGAAKTYAARDRYEIDANRELLGLGGANLASGLSSGMVVNGSLSKTAVNGGAGAQTQASGLLVAALTIVTLLFLTGLFEDLPEATLAAVVIAAVIELVDVPAFAAALRHSAARLGRRAGPLARTSSPLWRPCSGCCSSTPCRACYRYRGLAGLLLYRSSKPNVAALGRVVGREGRWVDVARHPETGGSGDPGAAAGGGLFFANADARPRDRARLARRHDAASYSTGSRCRTST